MDRLLKLQRKIDDIFNHRQVDDQQRMFSIIKTAVDLVEGLGEEHGGSQQKSLELISAQLSDFFQLKEPRIETIFLKQFLDGICDRIAMKMGNRNIRIERELDRPIHLITDINMLSMVCEGLLQNAIENTPDEGRICVSTYREAGLISVQVHDYGVGITPENQKNIFVGFFHTQNTDLYASKEPYAFNAGGAGVDCCGSNPLRNASVSISILKAVGAAIFLPTAMFARAGFQNAVLLKVRWTVSGPASALSG